METTAVTGQFDQIKRIQRVVRIINMVCAGTGVGLVITFLIMNAQLILGNGLELPMVPKLEGPELILLAILDLLLVLAVVVLLGVFLVITGVDGTDQNQNIPLASPPSSQESASPSGAPLGGSRSQL